MNDNLDNASIAGIAGMGLIFALVAWRARQMMMREALIGAAIWTSFVALTRILDRLDYLASADRAWLNGMMSIAVVMVLVTVWVGQWLVKYRTR